MMSLVILGLVLFLIIVRRVGNVRLRIWQIIALGATAVMISGQITLTGAFKAVNFDVLLFLFAMFIIGQALQESGYIGAMTHFLFKRTKSVGGMVLLVLYGAGFLAALIMNDTVAIVGTPAILLFAHNSKTRSKPLLLALAFGITIGSVLSPIGNPQNLLIALQHEIQNPFITFLTYLSVPTMANLGIAYILLRVYYPRDFAEKVESLPPFEINDRTLARLCRVSLGSLVLLITAKIAVAFILPEVEIPLTCIAVVAALPIVLFSPQRLHIVKNIDWTTLIFFTGLFILMASVWNGGVFQRILEDMRLNLADDAAVMGISVVTSQFISNVPMVALYLPVLERIGASTGTLMALAAGSTIAGNLTIMGAASNVIIIQSCEKNSAETISFWEFLRIGLPLTLLNLTVYWIFLRLF